MDAGGAHHHQVGQTGVALSVGVIIVYLSRDNELAFFALEQNRGVGTKLLDVAEELAGEKDISCLWV